MSSRIDPNEIRNEILGELRRELERGADKVITADRYPIRWYFVQTLVGICVVMLILFFLNLSPLPELPHAVQFWGVLLFSPLVNLIRVRRILKAKR